MDDELISMMWDKCSDEQKNKLLGEHMSGQQKEVFKLDDTFDPLTCGIPNICFSNVSALRSTDGRITEYKQQRIERGFDSSELWNLDTTVAKFLLPRLEALFDIKNDVHELGGGRSENYEKMIRTFRAIATDSSYIGTDGTKLEYSKSNKAIANGLKIFADELLGMWL